MIPSRVPGQRLLVQVEAADLGRVGLDGVTNLQHFGCAQRLNGLQAEALLQLGDARTAAIEQLLANRQQIDRHGIALEQRAPVGLVRYLATQQVLDETGLLPRGHAQDG